MNKTQKVAKIGVIVGIILALNGLVIYPVQANNSYPENAPVIAQATETTLKLYGGPQTRTPIVQWYLEELNIPYQYISLNIKGKEQQQPAFLAINPMGRVPALVDGDFKVWESGAILLYIAEKYGQMPASLQDKTTIVEWVIFANATLSPGLFSPEKREEEMPRLLTPINQMLEKQPFLLGDKLTAADIAVASYLYYAQNLLSLDYSSYPHVVAYLERMAQRPAFKNTLGKRFENK